MQRFFATTLILIAMAALPCFAQDALTLTMEDAVKMALDNNLGIKQADIALKTLTYSKNFSFGGIMPSLDGSFSLGSPNKKPENALTGEKLYDTTLTGRIAASWVLSAAGFTAIVQTRLALNEGKVSNKQAKRAVELSVRKIFLSLLNLQESLAAQKRNVSMLEQQYEQATARFRAGRVAELDMLSAQVNLEQARPGVLLVEDTITSTMNSFKQLLALPIDTELALDGSLEDVLDIGEIDFSAFSGKSLDVEAAEKALETADVARKCAVANVYAPVLSLNWAYQPGTNNKNSDTWTDSGALSASVSLAVSNFFPWSSQSVTLAQAKGNYEQKKLALEDAKTTFQAASASYKNSILQAQRSVARLRLSKELADKTYEMTRLAYNNGLRDLLTLQASAQSVLTADTSLMEGALTLATSILDYEDELNLPFGTIAAMSEKNGRGLGTRGQGSGVRE